jgi:hypothetical protein
MRSLLDKSGRDRFQSRLTFCDRQGHFLASVQPAPETSVSVDTFAEPRLLVRTHRDASIRSGDFVKDRAGRVLLIANHDTHIYHDRVQDRVHKAFQMQEQVQWTRSKMITDPVTRTQRADGPKVDLGPIWIARETYGREDVDRGLRVAEDRHRVVTAGDIRLGDRLGDATVRRLISVFGVLLLEIQ